jgi:hypothetical protein
MTNNKEPKKSSAGLAKLLPRVEILLIALLLLSFFVWAGSKCSASRKSFPVADEVGDEEEVLESDSLPVALPALPPPAPANPSTDANVPPPPSSSAYQTLYATLSDVKVRKAPHLDSLIVDKLALFEPVSYLNQRTDFRQKINIGMEYAYEPWILVQTRRGKRGWVYGAGLHYDKWDRAKERTTMPQ